ncbi:MAG TPA: hypothetical protein DEP53_18070 [Bacteroidetes bacterium]|nr:hypothetical protein [Bacteroidota bacterium]
MLFGSTITNMHKWEVPFLFKDPRRFKLTSTAIVLSNNCIGELKMNKVSILLTLAVTLLLSNSMNAQDFVKYSPSSEYLLMTFHYSSGVMTGISYFTYFKKDKGGLGTLTVSATKSAYYTDTVTTGEILKVTLEYNCRFWPTSLSNDYSELELDLLSSDRIQNFVYRVSPVYASPSLPGFPSWRKIIFDTCTSITINKLQPTTVEDPDGQTLPKSFSLFQNYPNPFNPSTTITYSLPEAAFVSLRIVNVLGQEVGLLVNEKKEAGTFRVIWNSNVASGIYFYRLSVVPSARRDLVPTEGRNGQAGDASTGSARGFVETKKMILLR